MRNRILENILFFFVLMFFIAAPCSVAYSEVALGIFVLLRIFRAAVRREGLAPFSAIPGMGRLAYPVLGWVVAAVLAALFAEYRTETLLKLPKLLVLGLVFFLPAILTSEKRLRHAVGALVIGGAITSIYGIGYYWNDPSTRLGGFVGNYMSMAGILMMIALVAFAFLYTDRPGGALRRIILAALPFILVALYLTNTRSSWLALLAGLVFMVPFTRKRYIMIPALLLILIFAMPGKSRQTAASAVDLQHSRNRERLFMWKAGWEIFQDHPLFGVGMAGMREIYLRYQDPRSKEKAVHLHNVPIQVLAAMGLTGFVAWLVLFGSLLFWTFGEWRLARDGPPVIRAVIAGALGVCAGFLTNGLAEWNMGDVEVITIFWSIIGFAASGAAIAASRQKIEEMN